jgi:hypothetical protein
MRMELLHSDPTALLRVSCKMSQLCFETFPVGNLTRFVSVLAAPFGFVAAPSVRMNAAVYEFLIFLINATR